MREKTSYIYVIIWIVNSYNMNPICQIYQHAALYDGLKKNYINMSRHVYVFFILDFNLRNIVVGLLCGWWKKICE